MYPEVTPSVTNDSAENIARDQQKIENTEIKFRRLNLNSSYLLMQRVWLIKSKFISYFDKILLDAIVLEFPGIQILDGLWQKKNKIFNYYRLLEIFSSFEKDGTFAYSTICPDENNLLIEHLLKTKL